MLSNPYSNNWFARLLNDIPFSSAIKVILSKVTPLILIVLAIVSLVTYHNTGSYKNEEGFQ